MADSTSEYLDVWLSAVGRISDNDFRALLLDRAGVSLDPQLAACLVLVDRRGPVGVLELTELLDSNHPKVSRSLAALESLGYVDREDAPHDRRVKTATTTATGHDIVGRIDQGRRRILDEAFAEWSDDEKADFARLSARFSDRIAELVEGTRG